MVKVIAISNAMALVAGAAFIICRVLTLGAPELMLTIAQSWFHTFDLPATTSELSFGAFILGLISSMIAAWVWTYGVAALYVRLAK